MQQAPEAAASRVTRRPQVTLIYHWVEEQEHDTRRRATSHAAHPACRCCSRVRAQRLVRSVCCRLRSLHRLPLLAGVRSPGRAFQQVPPPPPCCCCCCCCRRRRCRPFNRATSKRLLNRPRALTRARAQGHLAAQVQHRRARRRMEASQRRRCSSRRRRVTLICGYSNRCGRHNGHCGGGGVAPSLPLTHVPHRLVLHSNCGRCACCSSIHAPPLRSRRPQPICRKAQPPLRGRLCRRLPARAGARASRSKRVILQRRCCCRCCCRRRCRRRRCRRRRCCCCRCRVV